MGWQTAWEELKRRLDARAPLSRMAFVCLIGFVLSSPFSISVAQLFGFTGTAAWLASMNFEGRVFRNRFPLKWPWLLFAVLTLASAFTSGHPWQSLWDSRKLAQILLFYFALNAVQDEWEADRLVKALFAAAALASAWTLGWALPGPLDLAHRMSGFFSIYMTLGGYLVAVGAVALAYLFVAGGDGRRRWIYLAAALMGGALVGTFSRNAWIGLAVSVLIIGLAERSRKVLAAAAAAAAVAWIIFPQPVRDRFFSLADPKDATRVERFLMWRSGLRIALDHPLLGVGPGQIKKEFPAYADPRAGKRRTGHLHNNFLHLAAERGFPALAAWLWAWAGYFWLMARRLKELGSVPFGPRFRAVGGLAAAAGFFAAGLFEYNFGDSEVLMIALFAMALPFMAEEGRG
ncbi:MAG: O-antigen ligase family protein [Candidatus Tectomicrobia bacterium]|nr:O-antigen ligase family protein [Candidatus Tectomicrobia bacterium]